MRRGWGADKVGGELGLDGFGVLLRGYRRRTRLSMEALADACGVSARAISDLERGVSQPRPRTIRMLADALGLSEAERQGLISAVLPPESPSEAIRPTEFARLLREYRVAAQLPQLELARRALVSARAISDLERGVYRAPRRQTVMLL